MKVLWLMAGPPGSGKTTYLRRLPMTDNDKLVSRDTIRFNLLNSDDDYFAHEEQVFAAFIDKIQTFIDDNTTINIYIDATHLTEKSRNKVLDCLDLTKVNKINCINLLTSVETCIERNELREGRARVPRSVVRRMAYTFTPATDNEKYKYDTIINIKENDLNE